MRTRIGRSLFFAVVFSSCLSFHLFLPSGGAARADPLHVIGFNVESGDSDPNVVARIVDEMDRCDAWGLSEVESWVWAQIFERAAERGRSADYRRILGTTGREDRLLIIYNAARIEVVRSFELDHVNPGGRYRAPLVAEMRHRATGRRFLFMVNHLARGSADARRRQARLLNEWAERQTLPIIAVGDYNFDWDVQNGDRDHDKGYDLLTAGGVFEWVRPKALVNTQASGYDNVLDFVFVAGEAQGWSGTSTILKAHVDLAPDNRATSDHRPVMARFDVPAAPTP